MLRSNLLVFITMSLLSLSVHAQKMSQAEVASVAQAQALMQIIGDDLNRSAKNIRIEERLKLGEKYLKNWMKLKDQASDDQSRRLVVSMGALFLDQIGETASAQHFLADQEVLFSRCEQAEDCEKLVEDLSRLTKLAPDFVLKVSKNIQIGIEFYSLAVEHLALVSQFRLMLRLETAERQSRIPYLSARELENIKSVNNELWRKVSYLQNKNPENLKVKNLLHSMDAFSLYLQRLGQKNISYWLQQLVKHSDKNVTRILLLSYFDFERKLPTRNDWLKAAEQVIDETSVLNSDTLLVMKKMVEEQNHAVFQALQNFDVLDQFKMSVNSNEMARIESLLGNKNSYFHSFEFQIHKMSKNFQNLAELDLEAMSDDQKLIAFESRMVPAAESWYTLMCSIYSSAPHLFKQNVDVDWSTVKPEWKNICRDALTFENGAWNSGAMASMKDAIRRDLKRTSIDVGLKSATVLIISFSGWTAGIASTSIKNAVVTRVGQSMLNWTMRESLKRIALQGLSFTVGMTTGIPIYITLKRGITHIVTGGTVPFYDVQKSFMQNFARDILFGMTVTFLFPGVDKASSVVLSRVNPKAFQLANDTGAKTFSSVLIPSTIEVSFITSLNYAERYIKKEYEDSEVPVWRGWEDFRNVVLFATACNLSSKLLPSVVEEVKVKDLKLVK